jgi:SAM-dependent methyltransferase
LDNSKVKLNIGCGNDIRPGYINCDKVEIPGVDQIVDLDGILPFEGESIDEILLIDVLEHVNDIIKTMEELHRILKKGGRVSIRVPYWNSWATYADPTHKRGFHEFFFCFFDPCSDWCKDRPYYTTARFKIVKINPLMYLFSPYIGPRKEIEISNKYFKRMIFIIGNYLCSIVVNLKVELIKT